MQTLVHAIMRTVVRAMEHPMLRGHLLERAPPSSMREKGRGEGIVTNALLRKAETLVVHLD